jgi:hypothetical protein
MVLWKLDCHLADPAKVVNGGLFKKLQLSIGSSTKKANRF